VVDHLDRPVPDSPEALLCATSSGGYLARSNWNQTFRRAAGAIGLPSVRPHELRHTGATLAAATGATTKELMRRPGHSSPAATLVHQHAADDRDAEIVRELDATLSAASGLLTAAPAHTKPSRAANRS
jgi:integrase